MQLTQQLNATIIIRHTVPTSLGVLVLVTMIVMIMHLIWNVIMGSRHLLYPLPGVLATTTPQRYLFFGSTGYYTIFCDLLQLSHDIGDILWLMIGAKFVKKNSAKRLICMINTHNGTRWMHQMHNSGKKYANSFWRYVLTNVKSQVILILEANWRQFTVHTSLSISCDIFKKKCDIDILTMFWKWHDNYITIHRQTIFWGLASTLPCLKSEKC